MTINNHKLSKNIKGFTLIEVMIATSILMVFVGGLSSIFLYFGSSISKVNTDLDIEQSYNSIRKLIKEDNGACTQTLREFEINDEIDEIKSKNRTTLFKIDPTSTDSNVKLTKIFLSDFVSFGINDDRGMIRLNLEYTKKSGSPDKKVYTKTIDRIYVRTDGGDGIRSCVSLSHPDCVSSELLLGVSKRSFGAFNKSASQDKLFSGSEIMNSYSKNHEYCISHAICYEGEWKNISFCQDNFKENSQHSYWAPELGFTKIWKDVEDFGKNISNKLSCDEFKRSLNCNNKCRNNPLKIGKRASGTSASASRSIVLESCGEDETSAAYYHKNLRCNEFGEWQWDTLVCGRRPTQKETKKINGEIPGKEKLEEKYTIHYYEDKEPALLSKEQESEHKCKAGTRELDVPIEGELKFRTNVDISEERKEGEILLVSESLRFWVLACRKFERSVCTADSCNCPDGASHCYDYSPIILTEEAPETQKKPKVDILFVVDDSGSMTDAQESLRASVRNFAIEFFKRAKEIDFRLFVYTTGKKNNQLNPPMTAEGTDLSNQVSIDTAIDRLGNALQPGIDGSGSEYPLQSAVDIIDSSNIIGNRPGAYLNIIFITDAGIQDPASEGNFKQILAGKSIPKKRTILQGALHQASSTCGADGTEAELVAFRSLIEDYKVGTEKNHFDVCSSNYGAALARLAFNVINRIVRTYSPGR